MYISLVTDVLIYKIYFLGMLDISIYSLAYQYKKTWKSDLRIFFKL